MESKACTKCGIVKSLDEFYKHAGSKDGHAWSCKSCEKARIAAFQKTHPEARSKYNRAWRERYPERAQESQRKWLEKQKEATKNE